MFRFLYFYFLRFIFNFSSFIFYFLFFLGETVEAGQENKIKKRNGEILLITQALKTSKKSLKNALQEIEGFFMTENKNSAQALKLNLKVIFLQLHSKILFYFFSYLCCYPVIYV